ncbi:MAG: class I SAM-dependent methyltransferase [Chlamydiia bacterium]
MTIKTPVKSPISLKEPIKLYELSKDNIKNQLSKYFSRDVPDNIIDTDYSIWRCSETSLEFCWPQEPGNKNFYEWISLFSSYYPNYRWEYGIVSDIISRDSGEKCDFLVLDVGCGEGDFLDSLKMIDNNKKYAIDFNESAILSCKEKGLNSFIGSVETGIQKNYISKEMFSFVTSFHCLEHVADPVGFVRELLSVTKSGGKVFLSTPYSPMSFEDTWFDIMNHPPHHMTRWNLDAYIKMAKILNVEMNFFVRKAKPFCQALQCLHLKRFGANSNNSLFDIIKHIAFKPQRFIQEWLRLIRRAGRDKSAGSDVILIEFKKS